MNPRPMNGIRSVIDSTLLLAIIGLAFWTGKLSQRVDSMQAPGGVPISIEARERLTRLESEVRELQTARARNERLLNGYK